MNFQQLMWGIMMAASPLKFGLYPKKTYNTCILQSANTEKQHSWAEYKNETISDDEEECIATKKSRKTSGTKRQSIEDEVDSIYKELHTKHGDSSVYSGPQLRLWARMIHCGTHDDYEDHR